ncbi:MAG: hypothetical protein LBT05_07765 [Planctomycetaceae bacterium]|jgi:hypothetical protein|nr:hypothetical protein [Planctomycetaceae bacterium]
MKRTDQSSNSPKKKPSAAFLGVGFDNTDEQTRITRGKNFLLYGGSEETHGVMQETAIKVNEKLDHQGKRLDDVSKEEFRDILCDISESLGVKRPRRGER